jgi:hypothetical protein
MPINHRAYRDNPRAWLGTCVEPAYIRRFSFLRLLRAIREFFR